MGIEDAASRQDGHQSDQDPDALDLILLQEFV